MNNEFLPHLLTLLVTLLITAVRELRSNPTFDYEWTCPDPDGGADLFGELCANFPNNQSLVVKFRAPNTFKTNSLKVRLIWSSKEIAAKHEAAPKEIGFFRGELYNVTMRLPAHNSTEGTFYLLVYPSSEYFDHKEDKKKSDCFDQEMRLGSKKPNPGCPSLFGDFTWRHHRSVCKPSCWSSANSSVKDEEKAKNSSKNLPVWQLAINLTLSSLSAVLFIVLLRLIVRRNLRGKKKKKALFAFRQAQRLNSENSDTSRSPEHLCQQRFASVEKSSLVNYSLHNSASTLNDVDEFWEHASPQVICPSIFPDFIIKREANELVRL